MAIILSLHLAGLQAQAEAVKSVGYAISAILPENQTQSDAGYFDLLVKPGHSQVLQVKILNREDREIEVAVQVNTAFTNDRGVIEYTQPGPQDESMQIDFADIVTAIEQVGVQQTEDNGATPSVANEAVYEDAVIYKIPPNGEAIVNFALDMPDESFEGSLLGGLMFTMMNQDNTQSVGSVAVNSIYRYVVAVRIRESMDLIEPDFDMTGITFEQVQASVLKLHLRNPVGVLVYGLQISGAVYPAGEEGVAFEFERSAIHMAPNTAMDYVVELKNEETLRPGEYTVLLKLEYNDQFWDFELPLLLPE